MFEFQLIADYFTWDNNDPTVKLSVGDDAALLTPEPDRDMVISIDTSVSGCHFPPDTSPYDLGHKVLAVNLSDLAAMGATPAWFTLALTLPDSHPDWLAAFSNGLRTLADEHHIRLIGGDTTRGPLSITIQVAGTVPTGQALLRSGAQPSDLICVSGHPGDAAAGLDCIQGKLRLPGPDQQHCIDKLNRPVPHVTLGKLLRGTATSCIDISDGLLADLSHILKRSGKGARLETAKLPFSTALHKLTHQQHQHYALYGGDDYELLFTLPAAKFTEIQNNATTAGVLISCIGEITAQNDELLINGQPAPAICGYNHFTE